MKIRLAALGVLLALAGCAHTYRAERQSVWETTVSTAGTASCCSHAETAERDWRGVWPVPPASLRP
jgi:hypothetical protein